jgi:hypothetical protein
MGRLTKRKKEGTNTQTNNQTNKSLHCQTTNQPTYKSKKGRSNLGPVYRIQTKILLPEATCSITLFF